MIRPSWTFAAARLDEMSTHITRGGPKRPSCLLRDAFIVLYSTLCDAAENNSLTEHRLGISCSCRRRFPNVSDATEVKIETPELSQPLTSTSPDLEVHISSLLITFPSIVSRNMWLKHKGTSLPVLILSNVNPVRPVLADSHVRCHIKTPWETPEPLQKSVLECFYNDRLRPSLAHSQSPMPPKTAQNGDRRARLPTSATTFWAEAEPQRAPIGWNFCSLWKSALYGYGEAVGRTKTY
ncbi:hypothetical protein V8F33_005681 [Rhypophila sp. PSN 637]